MLGSHSTLRLIRAPVLASKSVLSARRAYNSSSSGRLLAHMDTYANRQRFLWGTIGLNVGIFGLWSYAESSRDYSMLKFLQKHFTLSRFGIEAQKRYHTLITCAFSHMDLTHLLFNMVGFYTFGFNSIHVLGLPRFAAMYFGGAAFSSFFQLIWPRLIPPSWPAFRNYNRNASSLGASGAVNAVVAWSILAFPTSKIYIYGILPVPAAILGVLYLGIDGYGLYTGQSTVGNAAHISGAAVGVLAYFLSRGRLRHF